MEQSELFEQVTALADNEIKDVTELKRIKLLIEQNETLQTEFLIQSHIKSSLQSRFNSTEAPPYLRERVINQILQEIPQKKAKERPKIWFLRPQFAFAPVLAAVILAVVLLLNTHSSNSTIMSQQSGLNNMFLRAKKNFQSIVDGKLPLEATGGNSGAVLQFFKDKGVKFQPVLPRFKDWNLIGTIVSDDNGEKLPHNVYKDKDGKLLYLYQANEECLKKKKAVTLSADLLKMLDEGRHFKYADGERSFLVWKDNNNICVLVSNDTMQKLEDNFLTAQSSR